MPLRFASRPPIWQWWDKDFETAPPLLRFAAHSVRAHNPTTVMLEGWTWLEDVSRLHADHQSDLVRSDLLARFGGAWLDVDYLCWAPIYDLIVPDKFCFWRRPDGIIDNDFVYAPPNNIIARNYAAQSEFLASCCEYDSSRFPTRGFIGADVLGELYAKHGPVHMHEVDMEQLAPYRRMTMQLDQEMTDKFTPGVAERGMMLINSNLSKYMPDIATASVWDLMNRHNVLGAILRFVNSQLPMPYRE